VTDADRAVALQREGEALLRIGRREEALDRYRQAVAQDPGLADAWYNLGWLYKAAGRFEEALDAYAQALETGITGPEEVHLNRAVIHADHLRRDEDARQELERALEIAPDFAPALLNLGNLHEEMGERERAIECYQRILARRPGGARDRDLAHEALARMAQLTPPADADDPLLERMRQAVLESAGSSDHRARANLLFALGRALDRLGLHDQAFDAFSRANRHARRSQPGYDRTGMTQTVDALIQAFAGAAPAPEPASDAAGPEPLFVCGMYRSGSTLVEQVLGAHSRVVAGGELDLLPRMLAGPLAPFPESLAQADAGRLASLAGEYRERLAALFPDARHAAYVTDKRPDNFLLVGLIKRLFPRARIVHTVRHPLDNGLSVFMQHIDGRVAAYANDLGDIGHYYGQYRRLMAHWKALYPDDILDFDYDAFVREPEPALTKLLQFLELEHESACLEFHRQRKTVKTASYWQVRRPLYGEASGRWRNYERHLGPLRAALRGAGVPMDDARDQLRPDL
jgi:tetratricopeptide (TPR) repeat protein